MKTFAAHRSIPKLCAFSISDALSLSKFGVVGMKRGYDRGESGAMESWLGDNVAGAVKAFVRWF